MAFMSNIDTSELIDIRVSGEMSIEVILSFKSQADREALLEKAKILVVDALKQAINDIPKCLVEAYCKPCDELCAVFVDDEP